MNIKYKPSQEYRYFLYDPSGDDFTFYKTVEDRDNATRDVIENHLDDGTWDEEVTGVLAGEITHVTVMCDKVEPEGEIDPETNEDEAGTYWRSGIDYTCNYKLEKLS